MMIRSRSTLTTFAAAFALLVAAPAQAQGLVSIGSGTYLAPSNGTTSTFSYFVTETGGGGVQGLYSFSPNPDLQFVVRVTSFGFFELTPGTTTLAFAGPIVAIRGNPLRPIQVGDTAFTGFNDNGAGHSDLTVGFSVVPPLSSLPPLPPALGDLTTIQQIVLLSQLLHLTPEFASLLSGNVWIR